MILIAQVLRVLLAFTSSAPANVHAIPSHTTAKTPSNNTIFTTNLISLAKTTWKPARPSPVVHLYFLFATSVSHPHSAIHTHSAPGTVSEVMVSI